MAVAPRLPPELLLKILATSSRSTLLSASLVSRDWRGPAQDVLESRLSLPTPKVARAWLACPGRKTRSRRLSLGAGISRQEAEAVFDTVDGLEELAVLAPPNAKAKFDVRALQSKQLSGLTHLHLLAPLTDTSPSEPLDLPFALSFLRCKGLYRAFPSAAVSALASASQSTLRGLDLDCYGSNAEAFISALAPVAGSVTDLELHGSDRQTPALLSFLSSSSALTTLTCWEASVPLLQSLPPSLANLSILKNYVFHSEAPYEELLSRSGLLRRAAFRSLTFGGISIATLRAQIGGEELLEECQERGIEVEFGVEAAGRYGTLPFGWPSFGGMKVA
ncbi:hypothetical protein JCM8097_001992 [Rhodosporidiobolus ruineniae]